MSFFLKKVVSRFLFPLPLSVEFLLLGLFLLWFTRRQRAGKVLVTCGALLLMILSNGAVPNVLLRPLERHYPSLLSAHRGPEDPSVTFIAVLGGSADDDPDIPITSHISPELMVRLVEGVRLQREIPGTKLILSGGHDSATGMAQVAEALGVDGHDLLQLSQPNDTEQESQQIAPIVGLHHPFILVTSAYHMPRAMGLFRKRGLQPIPAPTDYLAPRGRVGPYDLIPDAFELDKSQVAFYEYLGLGWEKLRGHM